VFSHTSRDGPLEVLRVDLVDCSRLTSDPSVKKVDARKARANFRIADYPGRAKQ
jgi:hypothetical protein